MPLAALLLVALAQGQALQGLNFKQLVWLLLQEQETALLVLLSDWVPVLHLLPWHGRQCAARLALPSVRAQQSLRLDPNARQMILNNSMIPHQQKTIMVMLVFWTLNGDCARDLKRALSVQIEEAGVLAVLHINHVLALYLGSVEVVSVAVGLALEVLVFAQRASLLLRR